MAAPVLRLASFPASLLTAAVDVVVVEVVVDGLDVGVTEVDSVEDEGDVAVDDTEEVV